MKEKADDLRCFLCIPRKRTLLGDFEKLFSKREHFGNIDMSEKRYRITHRCISELTLVIRRGEKLLCIGCCQLPLPRSCKVRSGKPYHSFSMNRGIIRDLSSEASYLLVVAKEHFDRQPSIAAYLEPISQVIQLLHLFSGQVPPIQLEILFNPRISNALGNDRPFML